MRVSTTREGEGWYMYYRGEMRVSTTREGEGYMYYRGRGEG